jgi:hypothetical protein
MPYRQKKPVPMTAMSPSMLATSLKIDQRHVAEGIISGALPVFQKGLSRRILLSDAERWVRGWKTAPAPKQKRKSA